MLWQDIKRAMFKDMKILYNEVKESVSYKKVVAMKCSSTSCLIKNFVFPAMLLHFGSLCIVYIVSTHKSDQDF